MTRIFFGSILTLLGLSIHFSQAQTAHESTTSAIDVYVKIWKEHNHDVRLKLIKTIWLSEGVYEDPSVTTKGPEEFNAMIDTFYKNFPNAVFEADPMLSKGNYNTWSWRLMDPKQGLIMAGRDVVELDGKGHILHVVGFWEQADSANINVQAVAKYYQCLFKTRDFNTMATLIAPGAIYHQAEGLPYGGTYIGFENWTKMFVQASGFFDLQIEKEPTYFVNSLNNGVIIRFTIRCTAKKSGDIISMPLAEHFDVSDGKITSIRPFYFDTQKFAAFLK